MKNAIHEFQQGMGESFHEAWERFLGLAQKHRNHELPQHENFQLLYNGLRFEHKSRLHVANGQDFEDN